MFYRQFWSPSKHEIKWRLLCWFLFHCIICMYYSTTSNIYFVYYVRLPISFLFEVQGAKHLNWRSVQLNIVYNSLPMRCNGVVLDVFMFMILHNSSITCPSKWASLTLWILWNTIVNYKLVEQNIRTSLSCLILCWIKLCIFCKVVSY